MIPYANRIDAALIGFGIDGCVVLSHTGPTVTQFDIRLATGVRARRVRLFEADLAVALGVASVRIVYPLVGQPDHVGIEIPHAEPQTVQFANVARHISSGQMLPLVLGESLSGEACIHDIVKLPHLLIAGRTGSGKSVCVNTIICGLLSGHSAARVHFLMIDPKCVELTVYADLPQLLCPVITDPIQAERALAWLVEFMEARYQAFAASGIKSIKEAPTNISYVVVIIDELADLMMTSGKAVEAHICRLAQKARAVGIHLVVATQRPSVDVITGLIKSNFPARISFQVSSKTDSRVVLDQNGAEALLGQGDMLHSLGSGVGRAQGAYIPDTEIAEIVARQHGAPQHVPALVAMLDESTEKTAVSDTVQQKPGKPKSQAVTFVVYGMVFWVILIGLVMVIAKPTVMPGLWVMIVIIPVVVGIVLLMIRDTRGGRRL